MQLEMEQEAQTERPKSEVPTFDVSKHYQSATLPVRLTQFASFYGVQDHGDFLARILDQRDSLKTFMGRREREEVVHQIGNASGDTRELLEAVLAAT